jgi:acid phosphatase family membrane protein YuiD
VEEVEKERAKEAEERQERLAKLNGHAPEEAVAGSSTGGPGQQ